MELKTTKTERLKIYKLALKAQKNDLTAGLCFLLQRLCRDYNEGYDKWFETMTQFAEFGKYYSYDLDDHKSVPLIYKKLFWGEADNARQQWRIAVLNKCINLCKPKPNAKKIKKLG